MCSSQSEAFQLPISPSLSLSHILHILTILGLAIYYMLCTLLVVSVLKEAGVYIGVCIHAVGLEFQSFSGYLHLGTILLIPFTPHSHIMHSAPSQFTTTCTVDSRKRLGLETICTVEVLGAPWLYCVF